MAEVDAYSSEESSGRSSAWKVVLVVIMVAVAVVLTVYQFRPVAQARATSVWFYDLGSGKLFAAMEQVPPIAAPSGPFEGEPGGVLAAVYSCGECTDESKRFVAWLLTALPEGKQSMERAVVPAGVASGVGVRLEYLQGTFPEMWQIRLPEKGEWLASTSPAAVKLREKALKRCGEYVTPTVCAGAGP